ncbi:hypothetical protein B0J13DRAFT_531277 [Dactylonectria estremocensis]|uniref:Uncharacterized protein n=1 Tax=Dactylonectria estremocensis TaxID=1079267 RepID=A0A9P9IJZ4_9HYPO|nr:hypothetical protein B0J13DRAFT_531277 [Dactylonectria estremocensis]
MHTVIFRKLSQMYKSGGTGWGQTQEHAQGRRLQLLIRLTVAKPSQGSYKTEELPLIEDEMQEVTLTNPDMSRCGKSENEKARIISSCFNKTTLDGDLVETYITHVRVVEYINSPREPPPASNRVKSQEKAPGSRHIGPQV